MKGLLRKKSLSGITLVLMLLSAVTPLLSLKVETVEAVSQTTLDMSPRACFLRVGYHWQNYGGTSALSGGWYYPSPAAASGPWQPEMPLIFDLENNGFKPGDSLVITYNYSLYTGYWWRYYSGISLSEWQSTGQSGVIYSPDSANAWQTLRLFGVFSSDGVVDADFTKVQRVPGAIDAGEDAHSGLVIDYYGFQTSYLDPAEPLYRNLDSDIPEDFDITPYYGFEIQIPQGARYIILGLMPSYAQMAFGPDPVMVTFEKDSDGDGLLDSWEQDGIDVDKDGEVDLDLPMMGADWEHKDLFVEVDYLGSTATCPTGHKPDTLALNDIKNAFADSPVTNPDGVKGVNLHILVDEEVPHEDVLAGTAGWTGFNSIKRDHFGTTDDRSDANKANILEAKKRVYHYCLFVHNRQDRDGWGVGELPGNDFMVSFGNATATRDYQSGVFMHELGHNLGLQHGGGDNVNYKPNYLSIMNYLFQCDGAPVKGRPLDYSRRQLTTLNESSLNELFGIGGLPGDKTAFSLPNLPNFYGVNYFVADGVWLPGFDGSTGLDWNGNGTVDGNGTVWANLNNFPVWNYPSIEGQNLTGYNDWANLNFNFRSTAGFAEGVNPCHTDDELTPEIVELMLEVAETPPMIPEFPVWMLFLSLMTLTLISTVLLRRQRQT